MISAKILLDSVHVNGSRLTTWELTYPRFIHSEMMTHRALSKNSASSRAIPLKRMLANIRENPAIPEYWGAEQKGMQSGEHVDAETTCKASYEWKLCAKTMSTRAEYFAGLGLHKSLCNRIIEWCSHITIIMTGESRGLKHFFSLRAHPAAQPEFQVLAYRMLALYQESWPRVLTPGEWHIPMDPNFTDIEDLTQKEYPLPQRLKIATGRIARVSYLTHDGRRDPDEDAKLHDRLLAGEPPHMSPFEHCAMAVGPQAVTKSSNLGPSWLQYRKTIAGECTNDATWNGDEIMARKPDWITLP